MDNYEVAISGTNLAAQILGIEAPEVQFFYIYFCSFAISLI